MSFVESTLLKTSFREAVHQEYQNVCLSIDPGDPYNMGDVQSAALTGYRRNFGEQLGSYQRSVSFTEVMDAAQRSQVVYVGDFHPWRGAKDTFLHIVDEGAAPSCQPVILLEEFSAKHNRYLKSFRAGVLSDNGLRARAWAYNLNGSWGGVLSILNYAKDQKKRKKQKKGRKPDEGIEVWGIDQRLASLSLRTHGLAKQVEKYVHDEKQIFVLAGDFHLAPGKLHAEIDNKVKSYTTIFQGSDEMFWQLLPLGLANDTEAVLTSTGVYCLNNTNPLFRAMVQFSASFPRRSDERFNKKELELEYKQHLITVLIRALGVDPEIEGAIDPEEVVVADLERLVYGTDDQETVRAKLESWVPTN
jgi:hypothetical protein